MKQCPNCRQTFTDDNSFCLMDGTTLVAMDSFENQSYSTEKQAFSTETPTIVVPHIPTSPAVSNTKQTSVPNWLYPVLGLLIGLVVVFGFIAFYAVVLKDNNESASKVVSAKPDRDESASNNDSEEKPEDIEDKKPAEPKPTVKKEKPTPEATQKPKTVGRTRIKFAKGAVSSTVSGVIDKNGKRVYVLKAIAGQYLSANVNSSNNCVVFSGQGSSTGFVTRRGDNQVELYNNCDSASFSLTVAIR